MEHRRKTALCTVIHTSLNWPELTCIAVQIQKMVISGGDFKPDTLKAKDMVSLLLHDDEMESRCEEWNTLCVCVCTIA